MTDRQTDTAVAANDGRAPPARHAAAAAVAAVAVAARVLLEQLDATAAARHASGPVRCC